MAARLQKEEDIEIIGRIEDGSQAMKSLDLHPDVLILDPLLFVSEELSQIIHKLKIKSPRTKILLLFLEKEMSDKSLMQYITGGVDGYIRRDAKLNQLVEAIRTVHAGNIWAERKLLDKFVRCSSPPVPDLESKLSKLENPLTKREKEIIDYLFLGLPNKRISHKLHISETTVKTHLNNIFKKMKVHNRTQVLSTLIYSR
jgi:DNA-binding NarL/FixJ family response regulator